MGRRPIPTPGSGLELTLQAVSFAAGHGLDETSLIAVEVRIGRVCIPVSRILRDGHRAVRALCHRQAVAHVLEAETDRERRAIRERDCVAA